MGKSCLKKGIVVFMILIVSLTVPASAFAQSFADTVGHWAESSISKWSGIGVVVGYDGYFKPNDNMTVAEFSSILTQIMGYTEKAENRFNDLSGGAWYEDIMLKVISVGIVNKDNKGNVYPNAYLTRHGMAAMTALAFGLEPIYGSTVFTEDVDIPGYAKGYINALQSHGYLSGYRNDMGFEFRPFNTLTRAEAVKIIDMLAANLINKTGFYSKNVDGNLIVNTSGVTLSDMTVNGNLYLAEGIGKGEVTLKNVNVTGDVFVKGGGLNSVYIIDSVMGNLIVNKHDGEIRIVAVGTTKVNTMSLKSGATIVISELTTGEISVIAIKEFPTSQRVVLNGDFKTVANNQRNASIDVQGSIQRLSLNANANIIGNAKIFDITGSQSGKLNRSDGIIIGSTVAVETTTTPTPTSVPSTDTNSNSDSESDSGYDPTPDTVTVTGINVGNMTVGLNSVNQLSAEVIPVNAANRSVTWTVINSEDTQAMLSASGVFYAGSIPGIVIVKATSGSNPSVSATATVTIAGTSVPTVPPTYTVNGKIYGEDAPNGLAGTVWLTEFGNTGNIIDQVTANADGTYEIRNVLAGRYWLVGSMEGYGYNWIDLTVSGNTVKNIEITPVYNIDGRITDIGTDEPIEDAEVVLTSVGFTDNSTSNTSTDENGRFSFNKYLAGEYIIKINADGYVTYEQGFTVPDNLPLNVGITKETPPVYTVNGKIYGEDAPNGLAGTVWLIESGGTCNISDQGNTIDQVTANADGTYEIRNVLAGRYWLVGSMEGYSYNWIDLTVSGNTVKNIEIAPVYTISGKIIGENAPDGLPGTVWLMESGGTGNISDQGNIIDQVTANTDGTYQIRNILPGRYWLVGWKEGYGYQWVDLTVTGNTVQNYCLVPVYNIEGLITDTVTGEPIEGAEVILTGVNINITPPLQTSTDESGRFSFDRQFAAEYTVIVTVGGYELKEQNFIVPNDLPVSIGMTRGILLRYELVSPAAVRAER